MPDRTLSVATVLLYWGNLWYSVCKKSLTSSLPAMRSELGLTAAHIGSLSASFSLYYGGFKVVGGFLTDILPAHTVFAVGLLLGSAVNVVIPLFPNLQFIQICWAFNGLVQGGGGPALSKVVIEQFEPQDRAGTWSKLLSASNLGYVLAPLLLLQPLYLVGWRGPFLFTGVVGLISSVAMLVWPVKAVGPAGSSSGSRSSTPSEPHRAASASLGVASLHTVLAVLLVLGNSMAYFIVKGISDWTGEPEPACFLQLTTTGVVTVQTLMHGSLGMSYESAMTVSVWCEVGAILGATAAGMLASRQGAHHKVLNLWFGVVGLVGLTLALLHAGSESGADDLPSEPRGPLWAALYALLSGGSALTSATRGIGVANLATVWTGPHAACAVWSIMLLIANFGLNGPKALLQLRATEQCLEALAHWRGGSDRGDGGVNRRWRVTGTVSGVVGLCAQLGAACSGLLLSALVQADHRLLWPALLMLAVALLVLLAASCAVETVMEDNAVANRKSA